MKELKEFWPLFLEESYFSLADFALLTFEGADSERFLNGQLTQDIEKVSTETAQYSARLNSKGQLQSWQILFVADNLYRALVPQELADSFKLDLEKFIIMDDVEITVSENPYVAVIGSALTKYDKGPLLLFKGLPARLVALEALDAKASGLASTAQEKLKVLSAHPREGVSGLVNETILDNWGVSYQKGCFLGQETAAKIHSRRGASYAPALLWAQAKLPLGDFQARGRKGGAISACVQVNDEWVHQVNLFREFRLDGLELEVEGIPVRVSIDEALFNQDLKSWAQLLFDQGTELFNRDRESEALKLLRLAIVLDPSFADAYEVIGVILGRHERYEEAIGFMDQLSGVDENSIMAHTNKSLYLMKLGRIEEAEEEKSKATIKTFEALGREAAAKREREQMATQEASERERRKGMFLQVLEIDPEDEIALFGLGDIAFFDEHYTEALDFFLRVQKANPKHSRSYLMAGKTYEALENKPQAREIYERGIQVATKAGELMPAREMRSRLVSLS